MKGPLPQLQTKKSPQFATKLRLTANTVQYATIIDERSALGVLGGQDVGDELPHDSLFRDPLLKRDRESHLIRPIDD